MGCIVLLTANLPIIGAHRFLAAQLVTLSEEVHLILRDFGQIPTTLMNHLCNAFET